MKQTVLPPTHSERTVISPTLNRWGEGENTGVLADLIQSVQERLSETSKAETRILIGDATENATERRAFNLSQIAANATHFEAPVYVMTPENQRKVVEMVTAMTGINRSTVEAILLDTGYAGQRLKLDAVVRGKVLTLDDDTRIPDEYGIVKKEYLSPDMSRVSNSQVLLPDTSIHDHHLDWRNNSIDSFFAYLGEQVSRIRQLQDIRVTRNHVDTMNEALRDVHTGDSRQFVVTHEDGPDIPDADDAVVAAAWPIKHGVPDYRTVEIAKANLNNEFPSNEVPVQSVLSGPPQLYAHQISHTNVDSAALARLLDDERSRTPWWFASNVAISKANPLLTVNGQYRSDNELLPQYLEFASKAWNRLSVYVSGIETQVYHSRARTGYRPGIHEQATASLVGNIAARESITRMEIDRATGGSLLREVEGDYRVPEHLAQNVFDQIKSLADICMVKMNELATRTGDVSEASINAEKLKRYGEIYTSIESKLAGFDFAAFCRHLNVEIRDQMRFFSTILDAYPRVTEAVQKLIREERYPVEKFVMQNEGVTFHRAGFDADALAKNALQQDL